MNTESEWFPIFIAHGAAILLGAFLALLVLDLMGIAPWQKKNIEPFDLEEVTRHGDETRERGAK